MRMFHAAMQSFAAAADDSIPERDELHKFIDVEDRTLLYNIIRNVRHNFPFLLPKQVCTLFECY